MFEGHETSEAWPVDSAELSSRKKAVILLRDKKNNQRRLLYASRHALVCFIDLLEYKTHDYGRLGVGIIVFKKE